jgi:hypothetical protein
MIRLCNVSKKVQLIQNLNKIAKFIINIIKNAKFMNNPLEFVGNNLTLTLR